MKSTINSAYLLIKIIWQTTSIKNKINTLLVILFSLFSAFLQYISIIITAFTFSYLTSNSIGSNQISNLDFILGFKIEFGANPFYKIILFWLLIYFISAISLILSTIFTFKNAYFIGKIISNNILKISIESNSIFHEKISNKTLFNLLTSENTYLIKGPIMALISLPTQIALIIGLSSIILSYSNTFFIAIPTLGILYYLATNLLLKSVRKNSVLVFDYRSQQTDLLTRFIENYLDVTFPPSNFAYRKLFQKITSKLRSLESFNAVIPRILKYFLELIIILTISFYLIYSLLIEKVSIEYFISSSAAIIISIFKLAPVISGISANLVAFDDHYESIKNQYQIFKNKFKFNLKSDNYNFSKISFNKNYSLKFSEIYSDRIVKFSKKNCFSKNFLNPKLIWIIGSSGCGKSTLFSMIAGIRPISNGSIKLSLPESKKNQNYKKNIFDYVSYMPQDPIFSSTTIREYIQDGDLEINDDLILKVIKKLQLSKSFGISSIKLLDLVVGPRGFNPSGGQAKLIAFSRAVCKRNVEIYLLDEPTSDLSQELVQIVLDYIYKLSEEKFVLSITHDLSSIREFDEIIKL